MTSQPDGRRLPLRKKLAFSVIPALLLLLVLELAARWLAPVAAEARVYGEHREVIRVLGLPALNDTMEYDPERFWRLKADLHNVRVSGHVNGNDIDFTVNTRGSLRYPVPSLSADRRRIVALGDSCTFGLGVNDDQTWPARLQSLIDERGLQADVINAGVPGYTAFQGRQWLQTEGAALRPDLVVACFGFNDRDVWASQSDFETHQQFARAARLDLLRHSRFLTVLQDAWNSKSAPPAKTSRRPRLTYTEFHDTLLGIRHWCTEHDAKLVLMAWPFEPQVRVQSDALEPYQEILIETGRREEIPVVNLITAFESVDEPLFLDHVHANPAGCRVAAAGVLQVIESDIAPHSQNAETP